MNYGGELLMKKCEKCQKEYDDNLDNCPYCSLEFVTETTSADSHKETEDHQDTDLQENSDRGQNLPRESELPQMFCKYCGNEILNGNDYCSYCGRDVYDKEKKHCTKCGNLLEPKQTFCDKCGQKASTVVIPKKIMNAKEKVTKKKMIVSIIAAVLVIGLVITGVNVIPKLFVKYDTYMAEGNYEKAYDKAGKDEKDLVIKENIAAIVSSLVKETLKDSSSFVLREVYIEDGMKNVVIKEQGNNSYGGAVSGYVWYQWNDEKSEFESWGSCSDFDKEEIKSWDDTDDMVDKLAGNIVKNHVKDVIDKKELKMDSSVVDRINGLNKSGKLGDVKLLAQAKEILDKKDDESNS